ncbi:unnamed protein product, partial [Ilex paraguariensis]
VDMSIKISLDGVTEEEVIRWYSIGTLLSVWGHKDQLEPRTPTENRWLTEKWGTLMRCQAFRDEKCKDMNSYAEEANVDYDDIESKSDMSDNTFAKSVGSLSSNPFGSTSQPGEPCSRVLSTYSFFQS